MWLLLAAAALLSIICCFNGYVVYRKQQSRFRSQRPLDLQHTVKQWSESTHGQLLLLSLVLAICVYAAFDVSMQKQPVVLLSFLVITLCSMTGFLSYRYLAYARTPGNDLVSATTQRARILAKSYSLKWYDEWQLHASYLTDTLVILVGLASFLQAIRSFSASTQLIITGCVAMPLCSLSGFLAYVYVHRKQQPVPQSELIKQDKQKTTAGLGVLVAFTVGYIGLKSSIGIPLLVACFALPVCCIAGFAMFRYQLYQHSAHSNPPPWQQQPQEQQQQHVAQNSFSDPHDFYNAGPTDVEHQPQQSQQLQQPQDTTAVEQGKQQEPTFADHAASTEVMLT